MGKFEDIRETVREIAGIATECPENLQQTCFEILLKHSLGLGGEAGTARTETDTAAQTSSTAEPSRYPSDQEKPSDEEEFGLKDIHVKVRKFLEKKSLTILMLNALFYREDGAFRPLYEDLGTTKTSENQIRISLLQALQHAMLDGEFEVDRENVKQECIARKCHDTGNFRNNFINNAGFFDFSKFTREVRVFKLSETGKEELASLIKELCGTDA